MAARKKSAAKKAQTPRKPKGDSGLRKPNGSTGRKESTRSVRSSSRDSFNTHELPRGSSGV